MYSAKECAEMNRHGFPHSDISGSTVARHLPEAYRRHATSFIAIVYQGIHHMLLFPIRKHINHIVHFLDRSSFMYDCCFFFSSQRKNQMCDKKINSIRSVFFVPAPLLSIECGYDIDKFQSCIKFLHKKNRLSTTAKTRVLCCRFTA
jgi:hypothetical protein